MPDMLKNLWFATDKEVCYKYSEKGEIKEYPIDLSSSYVLDSGKDGEMLLADGGGNGYNIRKMHYFNGKEFKTIKTPKVYNTIKNVIRTKKDSYYLAPINMGLLHFDGNKFTEIKKKDGLLSKVIYWFQKHNNELWMGTFKGISILKLE